MLYDDVYVLMIKKLENGLPNYLTYHKLNHTIGVIEAVEHLANKENVTGDDLVILKTAALFHDVGFLENHHNHEEISCNYARKYLPEYEYTHDQITRICEIIMATKLPQTPVDHLGEILADADLYYLGTNNYKVNAENLFKEYKKLGIVKTASEWQVKQIEFLNSHSYFTDTAKKERDEVKLENLKELNKKFEAAIHSHDDSNPAELLQDAFSMILGVLLAGFALKGFLVPNRFFDGGITGISLLIHELYHINLAIIIILLNLPLIIISFFSVGKRFAIRTLVSVILLGICLTLLPEFGLTKDKLLISLFGGVFLGMGIGLIMRAGAALDGIEVLALYTLKKTSFTITEIILAINVLIFTVAAFTFGVETALYSILTYFAATRSIDYVVEGIQAHTGVTIISGKSEIIKFQLVNNLGRGITVYKGERGFLPGKYEISNDCDIIFTVISRLELRRLKNLVYNVDPKAFVFATTIKEASGGIIKRRNKH